MDAKDMQSKKSRELDFKRPYRSSWIDFIIKQIERLPVQPWVFYLSLLLLTGLLNNVFLWFVGAIEFGSIDKIFTFQAIYLIYGTAFFHYLKNVATHSLNDFFPTMEFESKQEEELEFRLTHLPAYLGWIALILGTVMGFFDAFTSQYQIHLNSPVILIYSSIASAISYGSFVALLILIARQLIIVISLHRQVHDIDLFNLSPLRAFSRLTATAGFSAFLIGAASALLYAEISDPSLFVFYMGIVLMGISIFIIPLFSLRTHINKKKKQMLLESDQRIKHVLEEVRHCVQKGELTKMGELNTTLGVLEREKSILKSISSYPWDPNTLKSFISSILLPILIWLIKSLVEKMM